MIAVTSLARARPAKAASDFKAFSWKTRGELVKHLQNDRDSNGIKYSGGTSPVYKEKIQSGDDKIAVNLTKIQQRSVAAGKPDKAGCAAVYKTLGGKKYFPKDIKISYTDTDGNDTTKKFSIKDYYYDSANESVGEAGDGFVETDTKKTYSINTGHKDTEKALSAIVKYVYEKVKLNADRSGDVKIEINYYQPKVPKGYKYSKSKF